MSVQSELLQIGGEILNRERTYADVYSPTETRYRWCNTHFKPGLRIEADGPYVPSGQRIDPARLASIVFWQLQPRGDSRLKLVPPPYPEADYETEFDRNFLSAFRQYIERNNLLVPAGLMPITEEDEHLDVRQPAFLPTRLELPPAA